MSAMQHALFARHGAENVKFYNGKCFIKGVSRAGNTVWHFMGNA